VKGGGAFLRGRFKAVRSKNTTRHSPLNHHAQKRRVLSSIDFCHCTVADHFSREFGEWGCHRGARSVLIWFTTSMEVCGGGLWSPQSQGRSDRQQPPSPSFTPTTAAHAYFLAPSLSHHHPPPCHFLKIERRDYCNWRGFCGCQHRVYPH